MDRPIGDSRRTCLFLCIASAICGLAALALALPQLA
jgi:hypothetical protein